MLRRDRCARQQSSMFMCSMSCVLVVVSFLFIFSSACPPPPTAWQDVFNAAEKARGADGADSDEEMTEEAKAAAEKARGYEASHWGRGWVVGWLMDYGCCRVSTTASKLL